MPAAPVGGHRESRPRSLRVSEESSRRSRAGVQRLSRIRLAPKGHRVSNPGPRAAADHLAARPSSSIEPVELVLLDVGGPVYDDAAYRAALLRATRELAVERGRRVDEAEFQQVYDRQRQAQSGSLRTAVAERFLRPEDRQRLSRQADQHWTYPPSALYGDVLPALRKLADRYRIAVVANQRAAVMEALRRDGVADFIDIWALSEIVGAEKPDPAIFRYALEAAGVDAHHAVHVGNRLDNDVRGAQRVGLRTVWILRGEAPPEPTAEQLAEPGIALSSMAEVPEALDRMQGIP